MSAAPDWYVVAGHPVAHSRSPWIHARFAAQTGQRLHYGRLLAPLDAFAAGARAFFAAGGAGMNVTVPFKGEAARLADRPSARVLRAGAANTLWRVGARLHAENTDGSGLVRDLRQRHRIDPAGIGLLMVGAGGAARGVLGPLLEAGVGPVLIANRTLARAESLAADFAAAGAIDACTPAGLADALARWSCRRWLVLNASSAALDGQSQTLPVRAFAGAVAAYDMVYAARPTDFMAAATQAGCPRVFDGLGMLVEQAADSFACWRGVRPATAPVYAALRAQLAAAPAA